MIKKISALLLVILTLLYSVNVLAVTPEITSKSAILIDADTGQVLFSKEKDKKVYPASITKILTVYLAVKELNPDKELVGTKTAIDSVPKDSTNIAIDYDEKLTAEQAMYAAMLMSANDACNLIAEGISKSIPEFVKLMNTTAQEMGSTNTSFNNSNGLPDENHYTTASDFAKIVRGAVQSEEFCKIFGATSYTIPETNKKQEERNFVAKHRMLRLDKYNDLGIVGGKTGYTTEALHTAATLAEKDGKRFITVVFGADNLGILFNETESILHHGYDDFVKTIVSADEIEIKTEGNYKYTPKGEASFYLSNDMSKNDLEYSYAEEYVRITDKNGNLLGTIPFEKSEIVTKPIRILKAVLKWGVISLVVLIVVISLIRRHNKKKRRREKWKRERAEIMGHDA